MEIREAVEEDLDSIVRVQAETMVWCGYFEGSVDEEAEYERLLPQVRGYFHGTYDPDFALAPRAMFVAEDQGRVIGFTAGHRSTRMGCEAELLSMFVLPSMHRRGVGSDLLRPLAKWFAAEHSTHVVVDAPPDNPFRGFYLRLGAQPLDGYWLHWLDIERDVESRLGS